MAERLTNIQTEAEIIQLLNQKDERGVAMIYDHYAPMMYNVIYRVVRNEAMAQEVFQDAMVKIWNKGDTFSSDKGRLFSWLVSICRNLAIDKTRSREFKQGMKTERQDYLVDSVKEPRYENAYDYLTLNKMIKQLPDNYRILIELSFFQGYTHEEIAKKMEIPLGTVKTRIRAAVKKLRKLM